MASDFDDSDRLVPTVDTLGDLLFGDPVPLSESRSVIARYYRSRSLDIHVRWALQADDGEAKKVVRLLDRRSRQWPEAQHRRILDAVDQIVYAERATAAWSPKDHDVVTQYRRLASSGARAARLARDLNELMGGEPESRKLIAQLVDFVDCCLRETSETDHSLATQVAGLMLRDLETELGVLPATLIARLVCLAAGRPIKYALNESTVRNAARQAGGQRLGTTPANDDTRRQGVEATLGIGGRGIKTRTARRPSRRVHSGHSHVSTQARSHAATPLQ